MSLKSRLRRFLDLPSQPRGGVEDDHVRWGYRLFLDREPNANEDVDRIRVASFSTADVRRAFLASEEFQKRNPADLAWTSQSAIVLKEIAPSLRLFLDLSDVVIGLNIARDRFEEAEIEFVRRSVRPGDHVVDVGANIGFFSIWMASLVGPLGQVYAYDPLEQNAALLERSARENGFEDRIVLRRDAVASRGAEGSFVFLSLEQGSQNSGGAYLLSSSEEVPRNHQVLPTRTVSLDAESFVRPIHFLKVDVEG